MKIVGLKIEKGFIAATALQKRLRQTEIVDSFAQPFATDAELIEILKEKSKGWAGAKIVSSVPGHFFGQRTLQFPFSDRKRLEKALPFEIEDSVPFVLEDMVLDHIVLADGKAEKARETSVLGMALQKTVLQNHLVLLASAGIDPQVIVPSYLGLYAISTMMQAEGCTLLVCGSDLCMKSGGVPVALRSFSGSGPTGGLRHALQALETEHKQRIEKAVLLCPDGPEAALADLGIPVEQVAPELGGKKAVDPVSLGLALSGEVNFRKGEFAFRLADEGVRKKKRALVIAGAAAVLFAMVNLGVKLSVVQSGYGRLDKQIKDIYRETFPDARPTADPVRQMRDKLNEAKKKLGALGTGGSALDVMKAVTDGIPKEIRVGFAEFNLEGDRLKLQGEASSFESVDKIKAEIQKNDLFSEVTVLDTRMGVESKVKFRMEIKLKQAI